MEDFVERLKASRLECEAENYRIGKEIGERWAKRGATWDQLVRLDESLEDPRNQGRIFTGPDAIRDDFLTRIDRPNFGDDPSARKEFWEQWGRGREDSEDYLRGFEDGALEVFSEAAKQL